MMWRPRQYWIGQDALPAIVRPLTDRGVVVIGAIPRPETGWIRLRLQVDILEVDFSLSIAVVEDIALINDGQK